MYATNTEYDRGVNTFSPEGRMFQVEYATESIKLGTTAIGVWTKHGVVLAVENRILSSLVVPSSLNKIFEIDRHIGITVSGLIGDGKLIASHAREVAQNHTFKYNEPIHPKTLAQHVSDLALRFGESGSGDSEDKNVMSRPFGVALLLSGMDGDSPLMLYIEPSGSFLHYKYKAVGSGSEVAETILAKEYSADLSLEDAKRLGASTLKRVMEDRICADNIQVGVTTGEGFGILPRDEVEALLRAL
ncbi:MAG: 20S proteasome subunit alpha 5, PSMA5 [Amphiamblys sp. WSBS2006]|nr:MAG: 20S proteasome subunit alpha 5, PSMA5 [Amphiamblys sp. WSBS2006]